MEEIIPFSGDGELADEQEPLFSPQNTDMKYNVGCIAPFRINLTSWEKGERYWPRRLLHIPTLTSYERSDDDTYNGVKEPHYGILSYTWGRFQVREPGVGKSLPIKGVSWAIPAIQESHFTVDQFRNVLNLMRHDGTEWAWVDIACIDQENVKIKMDEVGRQASIFRAATWAYVWLSHSSTETCFRSFGMIQRLNEVWGLYKHHGASAEEMLLLLRYLRQAFDSIYLDPWFTSLWTLQEIMMRNDAFIVSSEGAIVTQCVPPYVARRGVSNLTAFYPEQVSSWPIFFNRVASDWTIVYRNVLQLAAKLENSSDKSDCDACLQSKQIAQLINLTGINHVSSNNPNVQYGVAKYRRTEYAEDRVYGIMQIYNIRVGQSVRPDDVSSLDELREEFGFEINRKSVVQGQSFVHTSASKPRLSWCITEFSDVPRGFRNMSEVRIRSTITKGASSSIQLQGKSCLFTDLLEVHNRDVSGLKHTMGSQLRLYLDGHVAEFVEPGVDPWLWWEDDSLIVQYYPGGDVFGENWVLAQETWVRHYMMATKTSEIYGPDRLRVLKLGDFAARYTGYFKDDKDNNPNSLFLVDLPPRVHVGMLIHKTEPDRPGVYERLGTCTWVTNPTLEEYRALKLKTNDSDHVYNMKVKAYLQEFVSFSKTIAELVADDIMVEIK